MKYSNIITIMLMVIFFACSKNDRHEVRKELTLPHTSLAESLTP